MVCFPGSHFIRYGSQYTCDEPPLNSIWARPFQKTSLNYLTSHVESVSWFPAICLPNILWLRHRFPHLCLQGICPGSLSICSHCWYVQPGGFGCHAHPISSGIRGETPLLFLNCNRESCWSLSLFSGLTDPSEEYVMSPFRLIVIYTNGEHRK